MSTRHLPRVALLLALLLAGPLVAQQQWGEWVPALGLYGHWTWGTPGATQAELEALPASPGVCRVATLEGVVCCGTTAETWTCGGGGGVTDHGDLTGLADDDHPQYLTEAEADALYCQLTGTCPPGAHTHDSLTDGTSSVALTTDGSFGVLAFGGNAGIVQTQDGLASLMLWTTTGASLSSGGAEIAARPDGRAIMSWQGANNGFFIADPATGSVDLVRSTGVLDLTVDGSSVCREDNTNCPDLSGVYLGITADAAGVAADSVALGADTTGGYAASVSEAGPATTATALAANGTNCSAGNYPLGVDAAGNAEDCTAAGGGGANPAGSGSEIQFRLDGTSFGAVTGSSVSGADITLGGILTLPGSHTIQNITGILNIGGANNTVRVKANTNATAWNFTTTSLSPGGDGTLDIGTASARVKNTHSVTVTVYDLLKITPRASPPATCAIGDLVVDTSGAYCACTATNTWSNMTATGACT